MREILFRGKTINSGEWVYGNLIQERYIVGDIEDWEEDYFNTEWWAVVDPKTVGQYTGLKDKNGTKIFEGDIVEFLDWKPKEVVWGNKIDKALSGCCGYMLDGTMHFLGENETYLIIGNIHDNSELLEEGLK